MFYNTFSIFNNITISCVYLFLTPNSRSVFCAGVSLNIHSFIPLVGVLYSSIFVMVSPYFWTFIFSSVLSTFIFRFGPHFNASFSFSSSQTLVYIVYSKITARGPRHFGHAKEAELRRHSGQCVSENVIF